MIRKVRKVQKLLKSCEDYKVQVNGVEIEDENGKIIKKSNDDRGGNISKSERI